MLSLFVVGNAYTEWPHFRIQLIIPKSLYCPIRSGFQILCIV